MNGLRVLVVAAGISCLLSLVVSRAAPDEPPTRQSLLERGEALYARNCSACHGERGKGDGPAAPLLDPRARDFSTGRFRIVSTDNGVPSDEDLLGVITRGMPGSAMPPWRHLSEGDRAALTAFVRKLSVDGLVDRFQSFVEDGSMTEEEAVELAESKMAPGEAVVVPAAPQESLEGLFHGRRLYSTNCRSCHGATARGDGTEEQRDESGFPTRPRDLTRGIIKGMSSPDAIWRRIRNGMPGSPMPAAATLDDGSIWRIVQYAQSLVPPNVEDQVVQSRREISAARVSGELPAEPGSPAWSAARPVYVTLTPLAWRDDRPEGVLVEALHDGDSIAIRLTWEDATRDDSQVRTQDFSDAVAIQFALGPEEPLFAMGEEGSPVAFWYWRASWEADAAGPRDVESVYPDLAVDTYPSLARPAEPGVELDVARRARAADFEPEALTGLAAGNFMSRILRGQPVEAATSAGFGTLSTSLSATGRVDARGAHRASEWGDPSWSVVFRRKLGGSDAPADGVTLRPGERRGVALAVWDGAAGDRAGQKSFSIWHDLHIER